MKAFSIFAILAVVGGCSSEQGWTATGSDPSSETNDPATEVGEVKQKAQFADDTVINLVDPLVATITVTADGNPTMVNIFYVGDKTTNSGRTASAPVLVQTLNLDTDQTKQHNVNMFHPAFNNGYGSILLESVGGGPLEVFQTYVQYSGAIFSTGGSVFTGGSYRIPYLSGTLRVVLALTNQSDFTFNTTISNVNGTQARTVSLAPLSTYRFDSGNENWNLNGTGSIQVTTSAGGTLAVSGYVDRLLQRSRITPVKAAPFP
jgi:hypothetical protein